MIESSKLAGIVLPQGTPTIATVPDSILSMLLASAADWRGARTSRDGTLEWKAAHPPDRTVRQVSALGAWPGVRVLEAVVEAPVLRPDGTVLDRPGYDAATGLLYVPNAQFESVLEKPTQADARQACADLLEVVEEFPFAGPAHRSAWLAGLLTLFCRFAFEGCAPIEVIEAPERGAGKGLLVDVQGEIATGRPLPVMPQTSEDEELRKRITSLALAGVRAVLLDNVTKLGGPVLDAALTSTVWSDRMLGVNRNVTLPLLMTWTATGNNVRLIGDIVRRINLVRLEPDCEQPDARTGFRHHPLIPWVRENRPKLVRAALTILRAYVADGRPTVPMTAWGRFEAWSDLVRASLIWAGQPDPYQTRAKLEEADTEGAALLVLFEGLSAIMQAIGRADRKSVSAGELADHLAENIDHHKPLRAAIAELVQVQGAKGPTPRELGYLLRKCVGKVRGGRRLCVTPKNAGERRYFLAEANGKAPASHGADSADGADTFPPTRARSRVCVRARAPESPDGGESLAPSAPSAPAAERGAWWDR
jgi:hypothetical protein